ncbi:MAG: hypothetical protein AAFN94_12180 [Pseudomonadota bacterium]
MADTALKKSSNFLLGSMVVLLYVVFVFAVAFGFGSYMYRSTWESEPVMRAVTDDDGETVLQEQSIDNMIFILRREKALETLQDELNEEIRLLREDEANKTAEIKLSFGPIARSKEQARIASRQVETDLEGYAPMLSALDQQKYDYIRNDPDLGPHGRVTALISLVEGGLARQAADADTLAQFETMRAAAVTKMDTLLEATDAANLASHRIQSERDVIRTKIKERLDRQGEHDTQIFALEAVLPIDSATRARLSSLEINVWLLPNDLVQRLVSFPTIFLTLIVTIAAGGLGTVVAFSRRYYHEKDNKLTASRLFVNVGEGIAAAIAIFLFSGAGMLALTQGGGATSDVELSPYTVAFVAFLSGFMAEDAFASIQQAGKNIFKTGDDQNGENGGQKSGEDGDDTVAGDDSLPDDNGERAKV